MRISDWNSDVCSADLLIQRSGLIQPNIHRALHRLGRLQRLHQHLDQIGNVEKIARLLAIAEHRNRQTLLRPLGEAADHTGIRRSEEHTTELQSLMRISYAVFCSKQKQQTTQLT